MRGGLLCQFRDGFGEVLDCRADTGIGSVGRCNGPRHCRHCCQRLGNCFFSGFLGSRHLLPLFLTCFGPTASGIVRVRLANGLGLPGRLTHEINLRPQFERARRVLLLFRKPGPNVNFPLLSRCQATNLVDRKSECLSNERPINGRHVEDFAAFFARNVALDFGCASSVASLTSNVNSSSFA